MAWPVISARRSKVGDFGQRVGAAEAGIVDGDGVPVAGEAVDEPHVRAGARRVPGEQHDARLGGVAGFTDEHPQPFDGDLVVTDGRHGQFPSLVWAIAGAVGDQKWLPASAARCHGSRWPPGWSTVAPRPGRPVPAGPSGCRCRSPPHAGLSGRPSRRRGSPRRPAGGRPAARGRGSARRRGSSVRRPALGRSSQSPTRPGGRRRPGRSPSRVTAWNAPATRRASAAATTGRSIALLGMHAQ